MKCTLTDGSIASIGWQYGTCNKSLKHSKGDTIVSQQCTTCFIRQGETVLAETTITRYHTDQDSKPLARKTTFALAVAGFSKEDKALLWKVFLSNVKLPGEKIKVLKKTAEGSTVV